MSSRRLVRCMVCGQPHVAVSEAQLRAEGVQRNDDYLRCSKCGSSEGFVDGELRVDELTLKLMACIA